MEKFRSLECILRFGSVLQIKVPESWLLTSARFCPTVQALQGSCAIFFSTQQRSNYVFITLLVHFISDQESGREQSNPSTVCCLDDG